MTWQMQERTIEQLTITDEPSFAHVALYADLKEILRKDRYRFRVLPAAAARWDRALLLNLTFWGVQGCGDVLVDDFLDADVVTHAAWHHLAARALASDASASQSAEALFFGEAIASAFDVYLVGRLLGHAQSSSFLESQVPSMAETADAAGLSAADFDALLQQIAADPERAFEDLRALLFDVSVALLHCLDARDALVVLEGFDTHRFAPLLHRFELSTWVLFARARAGDATGPDARVRAVDRTLREQKVALDWLTKAWVLPALSAQ